MTVHYARLHAELSAADLPVVGIGLPKALHETAGPASFHERQDGLVRIDWRHEPTPQEKQRAAAIIASFDASEAADAEWKRQQRREKAKALLNGTDENAVVLRAVLRALARVGEPLSKLIADIDAGNCDK